MCDFRLGKLECTYRLTGSATFEDRQTLTNGLQMGIFLCMRCATLHRKLGTHISKVKSLSMDSWSSDQVDVSGILIYERGGNKQAGG